MAHPLSVPLNIPPRGRRVRTPLEPPRPGTDPGYPGQGNIDDLFTRQQRQDDAASASNAGDSGMFLLNELIGAPQAAMLGAMGTSAHDVGQYLPDLGSITYGDMGSSSEVANVNDLAGEALTDPTIIGGPLLKGVSKGLQGVASGIEALGDAKAFSYPSLRAAQQARAGVVRFGNKPNSSRATKELRTFINDTTKIKDETGEAATLLHGTPHVFGEFDSAKFGTGAGGDIYGQGVYLTTPKGGSLDFASSDSAAVAGDYSRMGQNIIRPYDSDELKSLYPVGSDYKLYFHPSPGKVVGYSTDKHGVPQIDIDWNGQPLSMMPLGDRGPAPSNVRLQHAISYQPFDVQATYPMSEANYIIDPRRHQAEFDAINARYPASAARPLEPPTPGWQVRELKNQWEGRPDPTVSGDEIWEYMQNAHTSSAKAQDYIRGAGYDSIKYPGGRATMSTVQHDAYNVFDPKYVIPAFPTDAQAESLLNRFLFGGQ